MSTCQEARDDLHNYNLKTSTNNACAYHKLVEIYTEYIQTKSCLYFNF